MIKWDRSNSPDCIKTQRANGLFSGLGVVFLGERTGNSKVPIIVHRPGTIDAKREFTG
jgi:hypothetical protein